MQTLINQQQCFKMDTMFNWEISTGEICSLFLVQNAAARLLTGTSAAHRNYTLIPA